MKKLLLLIALLLGSVSAFAQNEEVVTETFGNWFKPSSKPTSNATTTNTSAATGITYTSSYTYWNNGGSAILIGYNGTTKGYITFSLPFAVSKITITSGQQTASGAKINFIAGEKKLSSELALGKSTDYPITIPADNSAAGTVFKIEIPSNLSKNAQIAKISYTKAQSGPKKLGTLSATCNETTVTSPLTIDQGTPITFHADNATSFEISVNDGEPISLTATNGSADWTPAICENASVSVVAKRIVEGEETQTSAEPLTFNLTVNAPALGELSATYDETSVSGESTVNVYQGTTFKFAAANATSFIVTVGDKTEELTAIDGSADWTPAICENAAVSVIAKRVAEGETTQTSLPLEFTLTVKKPDFVIADWVVTGVTATAGGSKLNNPLQCTETSAKGTWQAVHATAYSATNNGCAQLGSNTSANTFNGGTLTLSGSDIPDNASILSISLTGYNTGSSAIWSIKVGENTADNTITFSTSSATHTATVGLTGNKIVLTCNASTSTGNIKQTYISGISIKYTIPEDQPGEIVVNYTPQFCLDATEDNTELTVMSGAELRFSSEAAAKMEITSEDAIELPAAVNEANISWTVPAETVATITVTASSESGKLTSTKTFTVLSEEITPEKPSCEFMEGSKTVVISTTNGALMMMVSPYTPAPEENAAPMAIEPQGWAFTPDTDPKKYEFSYAGLTDIMNVSVKSVTPTSESETASFFVNDDGEVSGIEEITTDAVCGEAIYYNLQGQRVEADRPGLYIRRQGSKAEKVFIR